MLQSNPKSALQRCIPKLVLNLTLAIAIPILLVLVTLPWPFGHHDHPPGSTQNRMKQWGLIFKMYAHESERGFWPPLARNGQLWTPDLTQLYPDYLSAANIDLLVARDHPDRDAIRTTLHALLNQPNPDYDTAAGLMALSFAYLPFLIEDEAEFRALADERKRGPAITNEANSAEIPPLREGIERMLLTDLQCWSDADRLQAKLPVLIDIGNWKYREPGEAFRGAHVLFMNGQVDFVPLGTFPVVPEVMDTLSGIEAGSYRDEPTT